MANNRELSQFANTVGYNGGSIGIGTDNPDATLKVNVASGNNGVVVQNTSTANIALFGARNGDATVQIGQYGSTASGTTFGLSNANLAYILTTTYNTTHPSALALGNVSNKPIVFATNNTERVRIDSSGRILQGLTSAKTGFFNDNNAAPVHQIQGSTYYTTAFSIFRNGSGQSGPNFILAKGREAIVQDDDILGSISFQGHDGTTELIEGASIQSRVNGTPGSNDMPGCLIFSTSSDGSSLPTERLRITSTGSVGIGTDDPQHPVHLHNAGSSNVFTTRIQQESSNTPTDGGALLELGGTRSDGTYGFYGGIKGGRRNNASDNTGYLAFFADNNDGQSLNEKARIDNGGRLMVQCTSDSSDSLLIVQGNAGDSGTGGQISIQRGGNANPTAPSDLGGLIFKDSAGSRGAVISATCDGDWASNDYPTRLEFKVTADNASSPQERMRIDSAGRVLMADDGSYYSSGQTLSVSSSNNGSVQVMRNTNASFSNSLIFGYTSRSNNSAFQFTKFASSAGSDTEFVLRGDGYGYADGSWNGGGADYAEYFEWSDGNTSAEDRRGISVVLVDDKIREAVAGEEPIGVISGNPSVVGDTDIDRWKYKYLRDDYGSYLWEDYEVEDEDGNTVVQQRRQINPAWNSENEYVSREDRPEWDTVGLMGKLRIRKGQVTGTRWVKMRDVSDTVEEWLLRQYLHHRVHKQSKKYR